MKFEYTPTPGELEAIRIIKDEKTNWEEGLVFVTDDVQLVMRNIVKKSRRNYLGIYKSQFDPVTNKQKIFIPFTEWVVENILKNIDIDTKDIDVMATNQSDMAYLKAEIFRYILQKELDDANFGKTINKLLRRICIDGTGFLKAEDNEGLQINIVDRLNMLYDQSVEEIEKSSGKTERFIFTKPEFDELNLDNTEYVKGVKDLSRGATLADENKVSTEIPYVELYQRFGWLPKYCLTGNENDRNDFIYCKTLVSNIESSPVPHIIEEVEEKDYPYQDFKLKEVPNRADGRGIPEMLFNIQAFLNETVNNRLNKARIASLGLFKLIGNITPQMFKKLFTTGGIKLDAGSDVIPLDTGRVDSNSYQDEDRAYMWGTRVTGTTNDDEVAGNRPATNALIEQQSTSKGYNLRVEDIFLDMEKFLKNKVIPIIKKNLTKDDLVRITGDPQIFKKMDEILVKNTVEKKKIELYENAVDEMGNPLELTPEEEQAYFAEAMDQLKKQGKMRFIPLVKEILDEDYDIKVVITDENINKASMAQMLQNTLGILAQSGLPIRKTLRELYDILGLPADMLVEDIPDQAQIQGMGGQLPAEVIAGQEIPPMPQPSQTVNAIQ